MKTSLVVFMMIVSTLLCAETFSLDNAGSHVTLTPFSEYFIDENPSFSFEHITDNSLFKPASASMLHLRFIHKQTVWVKFDLKNESNVTHYKLLEFADPIVSSVMLYDSGNHYVPNQKGNFHNDDLSLNSVFQIEVPPLSTTNYYLNVRSEASPMNIGLELWDPMAFPLDAEALATELLGGTLRKITDGGTAYEIGFAYERV